MRIATNVNWHAVWAVVRKDLTAVRRSKPIVIPMALVPLLLLVVMPTLIGLFARTAGEVDLTEALEELPSNVSEPITSLPPDEQVIMLVLGFLMAGLFVIVPLMVSAVLAADAFAGEKERRTLESLLHLPIRDRDLFLAKVLTAMIPALTISWVGFFCYAVISNVIAWPVMERIFIPTKLWLVMIFWVGPAVALVGLGIMVRVSARARTTQEATQLGGTVILPVIFMSLGWTSGILTLDLRTAFAIGAVIWVLAGWLVFGGARRFTRGLLVERT
ncbi:MAG: hypothetical protein KatS3mg008_1604 [Acidimicrobiales bacterium]|nr:MAG: hypothetical protein KatS3mg008_1604 [Acidimicrobiales bacterium]